MSAIEDLFGKSADAVQLSDIEILLDKRREECHTLEYKAAQILNRPDDLSEAVIQFPQLERRIDYHRRARESTGTESKRCRGEDALQDRMRWRRVRQRARRATNLWPFTFLVET